MEIIFALLGTGYWAFVVDISHFLPHFRSYEVASLRSCVLPWKYRKIIGNVAQIVAQIDEVVRTDGDDTNTMPL